MIWLMRAARNLRVRTLRASRIFIEFEPPVKTFGDFFPLRWRRRRGRATSLQIKHPSGPRAQQKTQTKRGTSLSGSTHTQDPTASTIVSKISVSAAGAGTSTVLQELRCAAAFLTIQAKWHSMAPAFRPNASLGGPCGAGKIGFKVGFTSSSKGQQEAKHQQQQARFTRNPSSLRLSVEPTPLAMPFLLTVESTALGMHSSNFIFFCLFVILSFFFMFFHFSFLFLFVFVFFCSFEFLQHPTVPINNLATPHQCRHTHTHTSHTQSKPHPLKSFKNRAVTMRMTANTTKVIYVKNSTAYHALTCSTIGRTTAGQLPLCVISNMVYKAFRKLPYKP